MERTNDPVPTAAAEPVPTRAARPEPSLPAGPDRPLRGRIALVTGAASGIGKACAVALAAAGAQVQVVDVNAGGAEKVASEVGGSAFAADLADPRAVDRLPVDADIVVNNAGLQRVAPVHELDPAQFAMMQRIMVEAPFRILHRTLPGMYARGWGRVVNISSVHGLRASPFKSAYVTAKHALQGLSKVVALEGAAHGVTSNCVNPAYVRTPLVEHQIAQQAAVHGIEESEVLTSVLLERPAVKRLLEPEEVARAVLWLCGPDTAYVTGTDLVLDGGWTAH